jgi:hypothetical protein
MLALTEKLNLISDLENERLSEDLIEGVIHSIEHPEEWHHFETVEEANKWLNSDDEEDTDENA